MKSCLPISLNFCFNIKPYRFVYFIFVLVMMEVFMDCMILSNSDEAVRLTRFKVLYFLYIKYIKIYINYIKYILYI